MSAAAEAASTTSATAATPATATTGTETTVDLEEETGTGAIPLPPEDEVPAPPIDALEAPRVDADDILPVEAYDTLHVEAMNTLHVEAPDTLPTEASSSPAVVSPSLPLDTRSFPVHSGPVSAHLESTDTHGGSSHHLRRFTVLGGSRSGSATNGSTPSSSLGGRLARMFVSGRAGSISADPPESSASTTTASEHSAVSNLELNGIRDDESESDAVGASLCQLKVIHGDVAVVVKVQRNATVGAIVRAVLLAMGGDADDNGGKCMSGGNNDVGNRIGTCPSSGSVEAGCAHTVEDHLEMDNQAQNVHKLDTGSALFRCWRLARLDQSQPTTRIWIEDSFAGTPAIKDGDVLRLLHRHYCATLICVIRDELAPATTLTTATNFIYGHGDTVDEVIAKLLQSRRCNAIPATRERAFGLYHRRLGFWLDGSREMMSYEINPAHILELRERSREFILRIHLPNHNSRMAIKVIPSFTATDLFDVVLFNAHARRLQLERRTAIPALSDVCTPPERAGQEWSDADYAHYGLRHGVSGEWLEGSKTLTQYGFDGGDTRDELEFLVRYRFIRVRASNHPFELAVQETDTVDHVCREIVDKLVNAGLTPAPHDHDKFALFTGGSERLTPDSHVWRVLNEHSVLETYNYRSIPIHVLVATTIRPSMFVAINVDRLSSVADLFPIALRRFGIADRFECCECKRCDDGSTVNSLLSLDALGILSGTSLLFCVSPSDLPAAIDITPAMGPTSITGAVVASNESLIKYSEDGAAIRTVVAGTLDGLVQELTSADQSSDSNLEFVKTFLLTYRSFTTPTVLLRKLIERYHVRWHPSNDDTFEAFELRRIRVQLRVCNVLQQWIKKSGSDLLSAQTERANGENPQTCGNFLRELLQFTESVIHEHPLPGRQLRKHIFKTLDGSGGVKSISVDFARPPPTPKLSETSSGGVHSPKLLLYDAEEIARQLTIVEFNLFSRVMAREFINQSWTRADADIRAPTVMAITRRFNRVAMWVAKTIVDGMTVESRVRRWTKLVDVAMHLYCMNNFSSLMALVAGFNKSPVSRLKHTIDALRWRTAKRLKDFESLLSAESSYKAYRQQLHSVDPPCIPYLGVQLLDLTYIEDGNPDTVDGGLVNFAKLRLVHGLIQEVQQYQSLPYNLLAVDEIVELLDEALALHDSDGSMNETSMLKSMEQQLFALSLEREPRGADRAQLV